MKKIGFVGFGNMGQALGIRVLFPPLKMWMGFTTLFGQKVLRQS